LGNRLSIAYQQNSITLPLSLLFLGEWGEARRQIASRIAFANKNDDYQFAQVRRCWGAWIHLNAMDFTGVLSIFESVLPHVEFLDGNWASDSRNPYLAEFR